MECLLPMARKRSSENDLILSASGASPARRKTTERPRAQRTTPPTEVPVAVHADVPQAAAAAAQPSHAEIATLAYSYWANRGYTGGSAEEDWLRAEEELRGSISSAIA